VDAVLTGLAKTWPLIGAESPHRQARRLSRGVARHGTGMGREDMTACMGLKTRILQALKDESARTQNETRLNTLRLVECAIRDRDVCARGRGEGEGCPDTDVQRVLLTMVAQREEA